MRTDAGESEHAALCLFAPTITVYRCAHCHALFCWGHDAAVDETPPPSVEILEKTIGSRYCGARACREAEAAAHGLPLDVMTAHRARAGR